MLALTLPDLDVARVQRWCAARVPEHARHEVRLECQVGPQHLTIVRRAPWREELGREWTSSPIARLRYTTADMSWTRIGATVTFVSTSTTDWIHRQESKTSSLRSAATPPGSSGADLSGAVAVPGTRRLRSNAARPRKPAHRSPISPGSVPDALARHADAARDLEEASGGGHRVRQPR
jgi:hypothetical protein